MTTLLEKMFIKRFCLPINSELELYENGNININSCFCGHYNHMSCVFQGKWLFEKARILSYGVNQIGDPNGLKAGIHAEYDAIRKLLPLKKRKRFKNINILVIRLSGKNKLQSSKPCINCINMIKTFPLKIGYKIKDIYYSNENGEIIKSNISILENETPHYSGFYRNKIVSKYL